MSKLLVIESSLNIGKSITNRAVEVFVENYKKVNPKDEVEILDLNKNEKVLKIITSENWKEFFNEESDVLINQLNSADKVIISGAMINFNVPTTLKSYIDNIMQANKTFKYKYQGNGESRGLLNPNIKVQLILAQGAEKGWYKFGLFDKYLEGALNFVGITKIDTIIYDGTKTDAKASLTADEIIDKEELIKLSSKF
ncbi:MAG: FMN-dependent NADH-azoreductase [Metamycoplasmataceae bacterium]